MLDSPISAEQRAFYIAVCSGKGGVGKSTLAVLLAARFAESGKRTLLIDADFGIGDAATMFNVKVAHGFEEVLSGRATLNEAVLKVGSRLWLLGTAPGICLEADQINLLGLKECAEMSEIFDVVIVDTPSSLAPMYINLIASADLAVTVTTPSISSVADTYVQLKKIVETAGTAAHGLVVNRCQSESEGEQAKTKFAELIRKFLGCDTAPLAVFSESSELRQAAEQQSLHAVAREAGALGTSVAQLVNLLKDNYLNKVKGAPTLWNRLERLELLRSKPTFDDRKMVAFGRSNGATTGLLLTR